MVEKIKIKLEDLTEKSTPCEICVAMNGREVKEIPLRDYFDPNSCTTRCYRTFNEGHGPIGGNGCTNVHMAQLKVAFLNYFEHKDFVKK